MKKMFSLLTALVAFNSVYANCDGCDHEEKEKEVVVVETSSEDSAE